MSDSFPNEADAVRGSDVYSQVKPEPDDVQVPIVKVEEPPLSILTQDLQTQNNGTPFKTETTPSVVTPSTATEHKAMDEATLKAIVEAQSELGIRQRKPKAPDTASLAIDALAPKPAATNPRKRPGPKPGRKPGPKKPPVKRRKTEDSSGHETPLSHKRSTTPASARTSKTPAPFTDSPGAASANGSDAATDDGEQYCLCRKGDDHTYMLGCDGGCDDWYHGHCVNMSKEDDDLLQSYICPKCEDLTDDKITKWKPMCRREGCKRPARIKKGEESKYCSDECGVAFFAAKVGHLSVSGLPRRRNTQVPGVKASKSSNGSSAPDLGPFGGAIRAPELKSLTLVAETVEEFRALGTYSQLSAPSPTASENQLVKYTLAENERLVAIAQEKAALRSKRALLKDKEKFVTMAKERGKKIAEDIGSKQLCGYDNRLNWEDRSFAHWRESADGKMAFDSGSLTDTPSKSEAMSEEVEATDGLVVSDENHPHVCMKKSCQKHREWMKMFTQDARFEQMEVGDEMRRVDAEERNIKEKAMRRIENSNGVYDYRDIIMQDTEASDPIGEASTTPAVAVS